MEQINYDRFKAALVKIVEGNEEFVYKSEQRAEEGDMVDCYNVETLEDGTVVGSCLIGQAYIELGVEPEQLLEVAEENSTNTATHLSEIGVEYAPGWDYAALSELASEVQRRQDRGMAWGAALSQSLSYVESNSSYRRLKGASA